MKNNKSEILLAMPMFNNGETFDLEKVVDYLKNNWNTEPTNVSGDNATAMFSIDGETIVLATVAAQIPWKDIKKAAQYAYNWETAEKELNQHDSHILVTIMSSEKSQLERFPILTIVLAAILATSNAIGVYQGTQSLLIPKKQYLKAAELLKINKIPLQLWIYRGIRKTETGNNIYTYGLHTFGKLEMEFINSKLELMEMYDFLGNICVYVIRNNIKFKNGETLGYTAEQKIKITISKGIFVKGESLKLEE